jgi:hypothetical protein
MVRQSKICDLCFFNSSSFISEVIHEKGKFIWIPDIPDSINYVLHLVKKYSDNLQNCFIEESMGWMIPRLKELLPGLNFNAVRSPEQVQPENKINKIFLYPQSDTLADSLLHIYLLLPPDKTKIITPQKAAEGTEDFLKSRKIAFTRYSFKFLKEEKPDVVVFLNDWTKEVQRITAHCRRLKIATVCLQESVIDFGDHFKRMQHSDFAFVQGSQTAYDLNKKTVYITGNPRYENLKKPSGQLNKKVIINCNFTYNIYEDLRYTWLDMISETLENLRLDYLIIQHPRDTGDLTRYNDFIKTNSATVHNILSDASVLITRFSSLIHEAIIMGIPVIYFNPQNERMKYGFDFNQSFIQLAVNKEELKTSIEMVLQYQSDEEELKSYIIRHCLPVTKKPSVIISELLLNYHFKSLKFSLKDLIRIIIYHPVIRRLYRPFVSFMKSETT